jgi:prephenate dehydratase
MSIVAIQGIAGSFHDLAAREILKKPIGLLGCDYFRGVFEAVNEGRADYGLVAIENNLHGSINEVYRLLSHNKLSICGEIYLKIDQYLIGRAARPLTELNNKQTKVLSHPVALAQCESWLDKNLSSAHREEATDTAGSVKQIMQENEDNVLAIAGDAAAKLYGAVTLAGPINDDGHNYTRFILLTKSEKPLPKPNKTSIILTVGHEPGSLHKALGLFAEAGLNLTKLDSHPVSGDNWHYLFYIDIEVSATSPIFKQIMHELITSGCSVQVLGTYRLANLPI